MKKQKSKFITEKYLDKALKEHSRVILDAVSDGFEKINKKFDSKIEGLDHKVDIINDKFDDKFAENKKDHMRFEKKIDETWNLFDRYIKNQEDFRQEFIIMKNEMDQIKEIIKKKFGIEIHAI